MTFIHTPPDSQRGHEKSEEGNLHDELPNKVIISVMDLQNSVLDILSWIVGKTKNKTNKI
jgi:hypothetical protein